MKKLHRIRIAAIIGITVISGVMLTFMGACGAKEGSEKEESAPAQTIQEEISEETPEETPKETPEETPEKTSEETPEKTPETQQEDSSGVTGEEVQAQEETQKLLGGILSLEEGCFVIEQYETREYADGGSIAIYDEEKEGAM